MPPKWWGLSWEKLPGAILPKHYTTPAPALVDGKGYPGSKAQDGTWQRIIGQMRPHSVYVEAFYGSGQIFKRKLPAANSILIDASAAAIATVGVTAGVKPVVGNALKLLPELFSWLPRDSVVYCDPPYMLSTRQGRLYYGEHEMTDDDHATLLAALLQAKCDVLVSHYPHPLYSSQLRAWRCIEYTAMTRGGPRRECLWCNFDEPEELHDWRFAGLDYRQRYHMKRFVRRFLDRVEGMPVRKRGYVLHELHELISQRQGRRGNRVLDLATPPLALEALASRRATRGVTVRHV